MKYVARKPITVQGKQYKTGEVVDLDKVPATIRRKMIDQRIVISDEKKGA